ncbi:MAG: hypothetical protein M1828_004927 [Chrysothrix sp. TS-e1954]|nr:MAG: hypothetical protein M1828_004927 [Chrysothrix sp. TS-e1954]
MSDDVAPSSPRKLASTSSDSDFSTPQSERSLKAHNHADGENGEEHGPTAAGSAEHAPLLSPGYGRVGRDDERSLDEETAYAHEDYETHQEESKSQWYLLALTLSIGGLQMAWSVELISISPFLLSLGLSKAVMALVWIAGPLSGVLVQPYVGIRSDNCRSRWGRRRPFIMGGAVATMISLLALSWTTSIVGGFLGFFGVARDSRVTTVCSQIWAVLLVYVLDFAINVIQAGIRAYIVDCAPTHQQEDANAWASRLVACGSIVGNLSGYVELPELLPFLGNTQFRVLCSIACISLVLTLTISCSIIGESDPRMLSNLSTESSAGVISLFGSLFRSVKRLPRQIRRVCYVQIFAWVGWFPFLFYITTYVGGLYAEPFFRENPNRSEQEIDDILEQGTRVGAYALLVWSITTFVASVALPFIVVPTFDVPDRPDSNPMTRSASDASGSPLASRTVASVRFHKQASSKLSPSRIKRTFSWCSPTMFQVSSLTLRRAWLLSHVMFAFLMWMTFFVRSTTGAIILIGANGIPWALTNWAPFALIAGEISKRDAIRRGLCPTPPTDEGHTLAAGEVDETAEQAGVVLGIHNVAISTPQVIATLVSSLIFKVLQEPRGKPGDDSLAWVLRFGGLCALGAAWCTRLVGEGHQD